LTLDDWVMIETRELTSKSETYNSLVRTAY